MGVYIYIYVLVSEGLPHVIQRVIKGMQKRDWKVRKLKQNRNKQQRIQIDMCKMCTKENNENILFLYVNVRVYEC